VEEVKVISIYANDKIEHLKGQIQCKTGIRPDLQRLMLNGTVLHNGQMTATEAGITRDCVLNLLPPPLIGGGKRARVEILECRAMPNDPPAIANIFAMREWNPVQFLEGITLEQERMYLASLETRRTLENAIEQTVAILPQFADMKSELIYLTKRVNAAEEFIRSLVSAKLDGMEKGAWTGMVRLHLQERV
jgi:hypothetical protein